MFRRPTRLTVCAFLAATTLCVAAHAQIARYDGDRVVRVSVEDEAQLDTLLKLTDDVWSHGEGIGDLSVRVTPAQFAALQISGLRFVIEIEDVQELIDSHPPGARSGLGPFADYMPFNDVLSYMNALVALRPDLASIEVLGQSIEGRNLVAIRITGPGPTPKPAALFHGGQHAREWITVPTTLYVADRLVRDYDTDPLIRTLVDRMEWYLLPVMNPDGYVYSWTTQRLWRKNRRNNGNGSFGVDLNRNWGYQWGGEGASTSPSNDTYRGTAPFSEPETQALRDFIAARPNLVAYNDIHSYSQLILWPFGYANVLPADNAVFTEIGSTMADIIRSVHGKDYVYGPIYTTIYPASGGSTDWVYGSQGIIGFSFELRDTGEFGFLLPPEQILPTCEEIFPSLLYYADFQSAPLRLSFPAGLPSLAAPGQATPVTLAVVENTDQVNPSGGVLYARQAPQTEFTAYPMTTGDSQTFEGVLPAGGCDGPIEFYFAMTSAQGNTVYSPLGAPNVVYSVPVGTLNVFLEDDFEANLGWTVANGPGLTDGAWERGVPIGGGGRGDPPTDYDGSGQCYLTANRFGNSDVDGGYTDLFSPLIDVAGADAEISYARWYSNHSGAAPFQDVFIVSISNDGGQSWVELEQVGPTGPEAAGGWYVRTVRIGDFVTPTSTVRLRFRAQDLGAGSVVEAAIDAFTVKELTCESDPNVPGDMNCDGIVTPGDISGFVLALTDPAAYVAANPNCNLLNGDVNGDGIVSPGDIAAFVALLTGS